MYKNVGKKIKVLSIIFAWILIIAVCLGAFYFLFSNDYTNTNNILICAGVIVGGSLLSIIISWFIYAYGQIAHKVQSIDEKLDDVIDALQSLNYEISHSNLENAGTKVIDDFFDKAEKSRETFEQDELDSPFQFPQSRQELFDSQMKKLRKDYEMSKITYDEYDEGIKRLEKKYK